MIKLPDLEQGQGPVFILNLLKFKNRDLYFNKYIPAFIRVVKQLGIRDAKVILVSKVIANIVADENESWDEIALVEYPSAEAFITMAQSETYRDIASPCV